MIRLHWLRILLATLLALVIAGVPVQADVSAQSNAEPTNYKTEITGWDVRIAGPNFALADVALEEYPHGKGERVYVSSVDSLVFAEISFFDDTDSPEDTIAVMMTQFETTSQDFAIIASGIDDGVHFSLAKFQISDEFAGYFYIEVAQDITGQIDVAQSFYTINEDFLAQLATASQEISIDGTAFLGAPALDLDTAIANEERIVASAVAQATPAETRYIYSATGGELQVLPPISLDYNVHNDEIEAAYISSAEGFGIVGYMTQVAESPVDVIETIFAAAPTGDEAPILLHLQQETEHTVAVYRIHIDDATTIMVIEVTAADSDLWLVEAVAVSESQLVSEFEDYQRAVTLNGKHFLAGISAEELEAIVTSNQP